MANALNPIDGSGSITLGGTVQAGPVANAGRSHLFVQNISDTTMWVNFGVTAVGDQPSIQIAAGAILRYDAPGFVPQGAVSIMGATTGKKFVLKEA